MLMPYGLQLPWLQVYDRPQNALHGRRNQQLPAESGEGQGLQGHLYDMIGDPGVAEYYAEELGEWADAPSEPYKAGAVNRHNRPSSHPYQYASAVPNEHQNEPSGLKYGVQTGKHSC